MKNARAYFKDKKVTVMGLGLLGKGLGDTIFLAECGAEVTVTDLKTAPELATSLEALKKYKNVRLVLGKHEFSDFEKCDFVLKAQGVPLDSPYIAHARKNNIPIRMDDELFIELAPKNIKVVGITGTRGKTTTTSLIYHILKKAGVRVHLGGNIRGVATLSLLKKVKAGDVVVLELSSWQLQGFGESKIAPHISVFTNFMHDHMNYYKNRKQYWDDKAFIFKYQNAGDVLIIGETLAKKIPKSYKGTLLVASPVAVPKTWRPEVVGVHNLENIACAVRVAQALKIPLGEIKTGVESFKAVTGRLQYVKTVRGVKIYNDNSSSTPEATIVALQSFPPKKVVLIMGGADKGLDIAPLQKAIKKYAKQAVLLSGTGTKRLGDALEVFDLQGVLHKALSVAEKGDVVLFSPAFASFGAFVNVYDRGDQFMELVKKLK